MTLNPVFPHEPVISIFLNSKPIPNVQADFSILIRDTESIGCHQLTGETIISVPANSILELRNNSFFNNQSIITCDNGVNAVELTIVKLSL